MYSTSARQLLSDHGRNISPCVQGKSERRAFSFRDAQCWCSVSTQFYSTTVSRSLTARTDGHTQHVIFLLFKLSQEHTYRGLKKQNNNNGRRTTVITHDTRETMFLSQFMCKTTAATASHSAFTLLRKETAFPRCRVMDMN